MTLNLQLGMWIGQTIPGKENTHARHSRYRWNFQRMTGFVTKWKSLTPELLRGTPHVHRNLRDSKWTNLYALQRARPNGTDNTCLDRILTNVQAEPFLAGRILKPAFTPSFHEWPRFLLTHSRALPPDPYPRTLCAGGKSVPGRALI